MASETNILPILSLAKYKPQTQAKTQNTNQKLREKRKGGPRERERESREGVKERERKAFVSCIFFPLILRLDLGGTTWSLSFGRST